MSARMMVERLEGVPDRFYGTRSVPTTLVFALARLRHDGHVLDDVIDEAVFGGFFGRHEAVAVGVFLDLFERLAGVLEQDLVELLLDPLNSLAWIMMSSAVPSMPASGWWIMIRALGRACRLPAAPAVSSTAPIDARLADAVGGHVAGDELHRVVDRQAGA